MKIQRCCAADPFIKVELEEELKKSGVVNSYLKPGWKYYRINESAVRILKGITDI